MFRDPWEQRRREAQRRAVEEQRRAAAERERLLAARRAQARRQAAEGRVPRWRRDAEAELRRDQERRLADRRREAELEAEEQRRLEALRDRAQAEPDSEDPEEPEAVEEAAPRSSEHPATAEPKVVPIASAVPSVDDEVARVRARLERDAEAAVAREREALLNDFIEVVDDLDRALGSAEGREDDLTRGVAMVRERFLGKLAKHGVQRVAVERGDRFDPKAHEAIATVPSTVDDDGRVVEVVRPAYRVDERVVRPAQVVVGRRA